MSNHVWDDNGHDDVPHVLVIGAMAADAKGQPTVALMPGTSTPGIVRLSVGGVGRNIAANLAQLGVPTILISAIGNDPIGNLILQNTAQSGVDVAHVITSERHRSGTFISILDQDGTSSLAIDDMAVVDALTPALIYQNRRLFRDASMVILDANVPPKTIDTVFNLCRRYDRQVCVDPTSAILAPRFKPYLPDITLMTPNLIEAKTIAGIAPDQEIDVQYLAMQLVSMGVEIAIITLAEKGLYYATSDENGRVLALNRDVVDLAGAGDALTAAVVFGLLNDLAIGEAVRLGISAAALTIQCQETVCPNLSLDCLYDELVI
ncbi:MAG: carbohydrate kinase family protein [Anaerolineae bacterium]|nr:carbohydrate kinase family protein [Anaerolineae bacterium]